MEDEHLDIEYVEMIYRQAKLEFPHLLRMRAEQALRWGEDDGKSLYKLLAVLGEEFGETCKAILEGVEGHPLRAGNARNEALQTAAVAVAIAEQMTKIIDKARER